MHEKELEILEHLHHNTSLHQRDLSRIVGLSLGMTNAILKRLAKKGFLMVRKVNNRNIKYIVSPAGVEEISRRSFTYFKRTIKNIVDYKDQLEQSLRKIQAEGVRRVVLEGESDVDFIIEHLCNKIGLQFHRSRSRYEPGVEELVLVSENEEPGEKADLAEQGGGVHQPVAAEEPRGKVNPAGLVGRETGAALRITSRGAGFDGMDPAAGVDRRVYLRTLLVRV